MLKNIENASEAIKHALYRSRENLIKLLFLSTPSITRCRKIQKYPRNVRSIERCMHSVIDYPNQELSESKALFFRVAHACNNFDIFLICKRSIYARGLLPGLFHLFVEQIEPHRLTQFLSNVTSSRQGSLHKNALFPHF